MNLRLYMAWLLASCLPFAATSAKASSYSSADGTWQCQVSANASVLAPNFVSYEASLNQKQAREIADFLAQAVADDPQRCFIVQGVARQGERFSVSSPLAVKRRSLITEVMRQAQMRFVESEKPLDTRLQEKINRSNGKALILTGTLKADTSQEAPRAGP